MLTPGARSQLHAAAPLLLVQHLHVQAGIPKYSVYDVFTPEALQGLHMAQHS